MHSEDHLAHEALCAVQEQRRAYLKNFLKAVPSAATRQGSNARAASSWVVGSTERSSLREPTHQAPAGEGGKCSSDRAVVRAGCGGGKAAHAMAGTLVADGW